MSAARFFALVALVGWTALLATPLFEPPAAGGVGAFLDVRTLGDLAHVLGRVLLLAGGVALRYAPLGALLVLVLPDHPGRLRRGALVALPALPAATAFAWLALARRAGSAPGPFELVLPAFGILLGVAAGLAWRRGWRARILFLPSLAGLAAVLLLVAAGLFALALDSTPSLGEPRTLSSAEKRHLVELFRDKSPRWLPEGEVLTLSLTGSELDRLASWAALSIGSRIRPALRLQAGGLGAAVSLRVPRVGRWLNAEAAASARIERGRLSLDSVELKVGRLRVPTLLLRAVTPFLVAGLQGDRDLRSVLPAVDALAFTPETATLRYSRVDLPPGLVARLVWGEEANDATREIVYAHVDRLLAVLAATPEGDARFARALETAFRAARERSAVPGSAADENRAAILALGIVLGHERLARSVGEPLDDDRSAATLAVLSKTSLRGRPDWSRHFTLSGALTVLSAVTPSDAAGLLKEELDAGGGSGFSFADLLADRSGTTFAEVATRDDDSARRLQERLQAGFRVDDFFPPAADLPEGIQDAELQARYGGVGGKLYREKLDEIERRLAACPAYR